MKINGFYGFSACASSIPIPSQHAHLHKGCPKKRYQIEALAKQGSWSARSLRKAFAEQDFSAAQPAAIEARSCRGRRQHNKNQHEKWTGECFTLAP